MADTDYDRAWWSATASQRERWRRRDAADAAEEASDDVLKLRDAAVGFLSVWEAVRPNLDNLPSPFVGNRHHDWEEVVVLMEMAASIDIDAYRAAALDALL